MLFHIHVDSKQDIYIPILPQTTTPTHLPHTKHSPLSSNENTPAKPAVHSSLLLSWQLAQGDRRVGAIMHRPCNRREESV